jgi:hypothetical protein
MMCSEYLKIVAEKSFKLYESERALYSLYILLLYYVRIVRQHSK